MSGCVNPCPSVSSFGAGAFGHWGTDEAGRACFHYDPPPGRDAPHEDHWHLVGNERISVTCHNAGYVQIYDWTRGPKILNRWHPKSGNYAGGFVYVRAHGVTFPTLTPWLPEGATMERVFGQGYFKKMTRWRGLVVEEVLFVLPDDKSNIYHDVRLTNTSQSPMPMNATLYWQVNLHQLIVAPLMAHGLIRPVEWLRHRINRRFVYHSMNRHCLPRRVSTPSRLQRWELPPEARQSYDHLQSLLAQNRRVGTQITPSDDTPWEQRQSSALRIEASRASRVARHDAAYVDAHPPSIIYSNFTDQDDSTLFFQDVPEYFFNSKEGLGGTVMFRSGGAAMDGYGSGPAHQIGPCACLTHEFELPAGETHRLNRCVSIQNKPLTKRPPYPVFFDPAASVSKCGFPAVQSELPHYPWLSRETEWHSYYLQACTLYSEYFDAHFVDQGSAYGYLQGASGAPRDYALFVLALVYLRPDLAKETLRFLFRTQKHKDGGFPYATFGYGKASGGGVHSLSSDLDLFVFWALAEYLNVTRDFTFLEEDNVYYPKADGKHGTVLEHVRASWKHLTTKIGLGPHGLIRCGTGDWNDVLIAFSRVPPLTIWRGESSLNAGLATVALPALADALTQADPTLAQDMRALAVQQTEALKQMWTGQWVARGYTGWRDNQLGVDRIFLDTQAFGVLGGVWSAEQRDTLFGNIQRICVDPQPAGALALYPPMRGPLLVPGSDTNGGTWAAVDGWTTLAWMQHDPAAAWQFYLRTTMAARAEAYPDNWYGIWSGPDAFNAHYHPKPAETFNHNATPMHLFPIMNANRHALPLLDLVKFAGFGVREGSITYAPKFPFESFAVNTPLMGCTYAPDRCEGYYTPVVDGDFKFSVTLPKELQGKPILLKLGDSSQVLSPSGDCEIYFEHTGVTAEAIRWEVGAAQ